MRCPPLVAFVVVLAATPAGAAPPASVTSPAQVQQAHALARPVLRGQASDAAFVAHMAGLQQSGGNNTLELLYLVLRESITETNEDRKYFLGKLAERKKIEQALSEYLHELAEAARDLGGRSGPGADPLPRFARALALLERMLASHRDLRPDDRQALQALVAQDRRFLATARRLDQRIRAIARTPRPMPQPDPAHVERARPDAAGRRPPR